MSIAGLIYTDKSMIEAFPMRVVSRLCVTLKPNINQNDIVTLFYIDWGKH